MNDKFLKMILLSIAVCLWIIVLQNFGVIKPISPENVIVKNTVDVRGNVDVTGSSVNVSGSVDVDNTVDVNLAKVLGYPVGCRESYTINGSKYHSIDVSVR